MDVDGIAQTFTIFAQRDIVLPLSRQGYIDWADQMSAIVQLEENNNIRHDGFQKMYAVGLSHGGPPASYVVNTALAANTKLYNGYIAMNPFYGISGEFSRQ